jgi:hypothetical protein
MPRAHTLLLIGAAAIGTHAPLAAQMDTGGRVEGGEELEAKVGAGHDGQDQKNGDGGGRATGLTIHSENFALVRDRIFIEIGEGGGNFSYDGATASLEPTSVILLPEGEGDISILEQSYRNDTLSTPYLLSLFEGKAIEFMHESEDGGRTIFGGRVVSSGYEGGQVAREPIIQVNGKMRFGLPGTPLFPNLGDDTLLKPRLEWKLGSERGYQGNATVSYLSGGMGWEASYNLVMPEGGGDSRLTGAVSVRNHTGRDFPRAEVKLLAGEVRREASRRIHDAYLVAAEAGGAPVAEKGVEHKSFDEYHVYSLPGEIRLRDRETKQVEFLSAVKVPVVTVYKLSIPSGDGVDTEEGVEGRVQVVRRFANTKEGGLGVPLPEGTVRVYRLDDGSPEFLGEQRIEHTPKNGDVEIETGDAFDIAAKKFRKTRRDLGQDYLGRRTVTEGYLVQIFNRKGEAVTVNVSEQIPIGANWTIPRESHPHRRGGAGEARWDVSVPANGEVDLEYEIEYSYPL